jgi:hypothetical protein
MLPRGCQCQAVKLLCMRSALIALVFFAASARADLLDRVISRATDLAGPSFQSCGEINQDDTEDCFLRAYQRKLVAIGTFSVHGSQHEAAEARVLTAKGQLITISAYSDRPGLTEERCSRVFLALEFTKQRVRCRDGYRAPLGATILKSRPVWFTRREEHPAVLEGPSPAPACPDKPDGHLIAQLLVNSDGSVPEVQLVRVPKGCDAKRIERIFKRWRFSPPRKNGEPVATVEVIQWPAN